MKKSFFIKEILIVLLFALLILVGETFAQSPCPEGNTPWSAGTANVNMGQYGPGGSVNFQYRNQNGEIQIIMDWKTSFQNISDFVPNSALKKILENRAVAMIANGETGTEGDIKVYYSTDCSAKVKIAMKLDMLTQIQCCDEGASISENIKRKIENGQEVYYYNIYKYVKCGEKCCARIYHWKKVWDNITNDLVLNVQNPITVTISDCSGNSNFTDCITGQAIPCESGDCNQW